MSPSEWDPQAVKHALDLELIGTEGEKPKSSEDIARARLKDAVALAVDSLIWIASYSDNENNRLKAATYIVDRVMGKVTDVPIDETSGGTNDPLRKMISSVIELPNN